MTTPLDQRGSSNLTPPLDQAEYERKRDDQLDIILNSLAWDIDANYVSKPRKRSLSGNVRDLYRPYLEEAKAAIDSLVTQRALQQRLVELDLLEQAINAGRDLYTYKLQRLNDLTTRLDSAQLSTDKPIVRESPDYESDLCKPMLRLFPEYGPNGKIIIKKKTS